MSSREFRIIETNLPLGGRPAFVYVFCLPKKYHDRRQEIAKAFQTKLKNASQFVRDDAGILVYASEGGDNLQMCKDSINLINQVLGTDFVFGRCFFVHNYRTPNGPTFAELMENSKFRLPYLIED